VPSRDPNQRLVIDGFFNCAASRLRGWDTLRPMKSDAGNVARSSNELGAGIRVLFFVNPDLQAFRLFVFHSCCYLLTYD
jgi:hypothetical protein